MSEIFRVNHKLYFVSITIESTQLAVRLVESIS